MRSLGTLYAGAVTPMDGDGRLDLDGLGALLAHLAATGCDGAVLAGTTGEGPSLTARERVALLERAVAARPSGLRLIIGTGDCALPNAIALTRRAFELSADGVLILPPYYYKKASAQGLLEFFRALLHEAVPPGGRALLYHIPQVTGIPLQTEMLEALQQEFPDRLLGVKDSQGDRAHTLEWCRRFRDLLIYIGHDQMVGAALGVGAAGAILASANVFAQGARALLDAHRRGEDTSPHQARLEAFRAVLDTLSAPAALKTLLAERYGLPGRGRAWGVRVPLVPLSSAQIAGLTQALEQALGTA